jgi:soluble cytochrome b562
MSISSLDKVINTTFLTKLSRVTESSSRSRSSANQELSGQALYNSLRTGASNFAAGIQLLAASATFVNISLDGNEKLLEMVKKMESMANKANKGNVSSSEARQYRDEFVKLYGEVDDTIKAATEGENDFFDTVQMEDVLVRSGLDQKKVGELATALRKFQSPTETSVSSSGEVSSDGNPVPIADIQKALKSAVVDPDDPTDDRSGFFSKVRKELQDIRIKLETNVKALKGTTKLIEDNMTLVRAAGFAFLDVSNEMTGAESAEKIAEDLRARIRTNAAAVLTQSKNLEPIMVAGLAALSQKES